MTAVSSHFIPCNSCAAKEMVVRWHADVGADMAGRMENEVAIDLITEHIKMKLRQPELQRLYHNLEVIPSNFQIRGMHTLIRDRTTSKADFVFYADRLLRLVRPCPHLSCPVYSCQFPLPCPNIGCMGWGRGAEEVYWTS